MACGTSNNLGSFITFTANFHQTGDVLIVDAIKARPREYIIMFSGDSDTYSVTVMSCFFLVGFSSFGGGVDVA